MPETRSWLGADHSFLNLIPDELRPLEGVGHQRLQTIVTSSTWPVWSVLWQVSYVLASSGSCYSLAHYDNVTSDLTRWWFAVPASLMRTPGPWPRLTRRHQSWYWSGLCWYQILIWISPHFPTLCTWRRPRPTSWSNLNLALNEAWLRFFSFHKSEGLSASTR